MNIHNAIGIRDTGSNEVIICASFALVQCTWTRDKKAINTLRDRMRLAADVADDAVAVAQERGRL